MGLVYVNDKCNIFHQYVCNTATYIKHQCWYKLCGTQSFIRMNLNLDVFSNFFDIYLYLVYMTTAVMGLFYQHRLDKQAFSLSQGWQRRHPCEIVRCIYAPMSKIQRQFSWLLLRLASPTAKRGYDGLSNPGYQLSYKEGLQSRIKHIFSVWSDDFLNGLCLFLFILITCGTLLISWSSNIKVNLANANSVRPKYHMPSAYKTDEQARY